MPLGKKLDHLRKAARPTDGGNFSGCPATPQAALDHFRGPPAPLPLALATGHRIRGAVRGDGEVAGGAPHVPVRYAGSDSSSSNSVSRLSGLTK